MTVRSLAQWMSVFGLAAIGFSCGEAGTFNASAHFCDGYEDGDTSKYILPIRPTQDSFVGQANCGQATHLGIERYAYDFHLDMRTDVIAAREGTVSEVVSGFGDGKITILGRNYVAIDHGDGTIATYMHNDENLVSVGDVIQQGQLIAYSGNSGTVEPHLHFVVRGEDDFISIPVTFRNVEGTNWALLSGNTYKAETYVPNSTVTLRPGDEHSVYVSATIGGTCVDDGSSLSTSAPSASSLTKVTGTNLSKLDSRDGQNVAFECARGSATTNIQTVYIAFDASDYNLVGATSLKFEWKGAAGHYATACDGTETLVGGGGANPPYREIQVYKYNEGSSSAWTDVLAASNSISEQEITLNDPYLYKDAAGKVWFRISAGDPGTNSQCSSVVVDDFALKVVP